MTREGKSVGQFRNRRAIHAVFAVAAVSLVLFGTQGPVETAAVGWLGSLAVTVAWLTFAVVEMRRQKRHTN